MAGDGSTRRYREGGSFEEQAGYSRAVRHGPLIAGDPHKGFGLALRSMQFAEVDRSFDTLLPMMRAGSVEALYEATREWGLIDHNLVAADVDGHIGYRVRGKVPRRPLRFALLVMLVVLGCQLVTQGRGTPAKPLHAILRVVSR